MSRIRLLVAGGLLLTVAACGAPEPTDALPATEPVREATGSGTSSGSSAGSSSSGSSQSSTLRDEDKLAQLYGGSASAIGGALDRAAANCPESRRAIADYVAFMMAELDEKKPAHGETAATVTGALAEASREADHLGMQCSEVAAVLLVLMLPSG